MADVTFESNANTTITSESTVTHGRQSLVQPHDNPFTADGELSNKADYILRHSKISRTEIHIVDPDSPTPVVVEEEVVQAQNTQPQLSAAPPPSSPKAAVEPSESKNNGQEKKVSPNDVEVTEKKEPTKQSKKTTKCCSVM